MLFDNPASILQIAIIKRKYSTITLDRLKDKGPSQTSCRIVNDILDGLNIVGWNMEDLAV
jgi:hypothetical protein